MKGKIEIIQHGGMIPMNLAFVRDNKLVIGTSKPLDKWTRLEHIDLYAQVAHWLKNYSTGDCEWGNGLGDEEGHPVSERDKNYLRRVEAAL